MADTNAILVMHQQSRSMPDVKAIANMVVCYRVAVMTQIVIFPIYGLHTTLARSMKMSAGHCQRSFA